mmetsp:Transcript_63878/g.177204  ORF Transcript_63878/g.177204 Transcript_63878/m.177204 type:complete len:252 (+) Transcript_63878:51-806(+)
MGRCRDTACRVSELMVFGPLHEVILCVTACDLFPCPGELVYCDMQVAVLVCQLKELFHGLLRVEAPGLPSLQLREVQLATPVLVECPKVRLLLFRDGQLLALHLVTLPELQGSELAIAVSVLLLQCGLSGELEHTIVSLRVEECRQFLLIQETVTTGVRYLELLGLKVLAELGLLLVLVVALTPLLHVLHELRQAQLAVVVIVHLLKHCLNVLGGDEFPHVVREPQDLAHRHLAIPVRVDLLVHATHLLRC